MRLGRLTLMAAIIAAPAVMAGSSPATAARVCSCTAILSSGFCTEYGNCHELERSIDTFKPICRISDCRRNQTLYCQYATCKVVCDPQKK